VSPKSWASEEAAAMTDDKASAAMYSRGRKLSLRFTSEDL
jgi:hypothetical protein